MDGEREGEVEGQGDCGDYLGGDRGGDEEDGVDERWAWDGGSGAWAVDYYKN